MTINSPSKDHRQTVGHWLSRPFVWRIPVYQRHYAWNADDASGPVHLFWETVKEQTRARLSGKTPNKHYLGAVLVDNKTPHNVLDDIKRFDVVDGQQRLTTIQIALLALISTAEKFKCHDTFMTALENYIFSSKGNKEARLFPTNFDNSQFRFVIFDACDIVSDHRVKTNKTNAGKSKIAATYDFFKQECEQLKNELIDYTAEDVLSAIKDTLLEGFALVLIVLEKDDNAQRIFESLNNYAKPLTTFDLIRNNIFYRAADDKPGSDEELFHDEIWQKIEDPYWEGQAIQRTNETHIEAYTARMLVANLKKEIRFSRNEIFKAYKDEFAPSFSSIKEEIEAFTRYADVYQYLDWDSEDKLQQLDFGVFHYSISKNRDFYPVLFMIAKSDIGTDEKQHMINLLESYVVRRGVCGLSNKAYNKCAAGACASLKDGVSYDRLDAFIKANKADTYIFPGDNKVQQESLYVKFYSCPFSRYVFEAIEKSGQDEDERGNLGNLTVDHILPKAWEKNDGWKKVIDDDDADPVVQYIDTLGNLTLMSRGRNAKKSNRSWRDAQDLLRESPMKLNRDLATESEWNIKKIRERSRKLAERVCQIWPYNIE